MPMIDVEGVVTREQSTTDQEEFTRGYLDGAKGRAQRSAVAEYLRGYEVGKRLALLRRGGLDRADFSRSTRTSRPRRARRHLASLEAT